MGLDTSHDCWRGAYSAFMRFREEVAKTIGIPKLRDMNGYGGDGNWGPWADDPLFIFLTHSDCDGEIELKDCEPIARRLEEIAPLLDGGLDAENDGHIYRNGGYRECALQFARGLRAAHEAGENVRFH